MVIVYIRPSPSELVIAYLKLFLNDSYLVYLVGSVRVSPQVEAVGKGLTWLKLRVASLNPSGRITSAPVKHARTFPNPLPVALAAI